MDSELIGDMKEATVKQFRRCADMGDGYGQVYAIHAYAALCQAEVMERMADALVKLDMTFADVHGYEVMSALKDATFNRGDQSIADAISEQQTGPPDEPLEEAYTCHCGAPHWTVDALNECNARHIL